MGQSEPGCCICSKCPVDPCKMDHAPDRVKYSTKMSGRQLSKCTGVSRARWSDPIRQPRDKREDCPDHSTDDPPKIGPAKRSPNAEPNSAPDQNAQQDPQHTQPPSRNLS